MEIDAISITWLIVWTLVLAFCSTAVFTALLVAAGLHLGYLLFGRNSNAL